MRRDYIYARTMPLFFGDVVLCIRALCKYWVVKYPDEPLDEPMVFVLRYLNVVSSG